MAYPEIKSSPCTPEQIVDLVRAADAGKYSISRSDGVELIEQYAAVAAAEATSIKTQLRDFCAEAGCSGYEEVFEAALKRTPAKTSVSP